MPQSYFPFDDGSGANSMEAQWTEMAEHWLGIGVIRGELDEYEVFADSTGMNVKVKTGKSWMKGHYGKSDTVEVLPINSADANNPRIDRVILRIDWITNTVLLAVLQGVASANPVPPALTQSSGRWEVSLSQVWVDKTVATIASNKVFDERTFAINGELVKAMYEILRPTLSGGSYVSSGLTVSKNGTNPKQLDIVSGTAVLIQPAIKNISAVRGVGGGAKLTSAINSTYYLDLNPDGSLSWGTAHSVITGYIPVYQVTTDASGNINVITDKAQRHPKKCAFMAYINGPQAFSANVSAKINFDTIIKDELGNFSTGTATFTAPYDGWYYFEAKVQAGGVTSSDRILIELAASNSGTGYGTRLADNPNISGGANQYMTQGGSTILPLKAGDTVNVNVLFGLATTLSAGAAWFKGIALN